MDKKEFSKKLYNIFSKLRQNPKADAYRVVGDEFGYFELPKKKSLQELEQFKELYRGFRKKTFLEEFLVDDREDFFLGLGHYGRGIYTSEHKSVAKFYSGSDKNKEERILKVYINDCKTIMYADLYKWSRFIYERIKENKIPTEIADGEVGEKVKAYIEFANKYKNIKEIAMDLLWSNTSALAIILGFEVIDISKERFSNDLLILNRGKIHVLDVDVERIFGTCKKFKKLDFGKFKLNKQKGE